MTEAQIKQNAEAWVKTLISAEDGGYNENDVSISLMKNAFIAGAHSRDEEIKELKEEIESLQEQYKTCFEGFKKRGTKLGELMKENVKLRNPWISVEDRLPEIGDTVVINVHHTIDGGGEHHEDDQILVENYNGRWICDRCEQHRMGKYLFDTISKTTHWMPIPQIKKGE